MKGILGHLKSFLKDEDGQTSMEYILILAVVAVVIMKLKTKFDDSLGGIVKSVFGKVKTITDQIQ